VIVPIEKELDQAKLDGIARVQRLWSSERMSIPVLRRRIEQDAQWEAEHKVSAFSGEQNARESD
jgi:hypothetical protein